MASGSATPATRLASARRRAGPAGAPGALERLRALVRSREGREDTRHGRLRAAMLELMAQGHWSPGDKLPPEKDIAAAVGLSLGTVQRALARLAAGNVVVRRHGHGTFVSAGTQGEQLLHFRFVGDDGTALATVYAEALDRREVVTAGPWSEFLAPATRFVRMRRRINVADEFDCLSDFYVDAARFGAFLRIPFEELHRVTLRTLLAQRFNAPTLALRQQAHACEFPADIARLMKLAAGKRFGLVLEVFSYTHHEAPVSFQRIYIPANVRRLEIPSPHLRPA
jgi:DNA-binding GntR family transcriptional regulator